MMCRVGKLLINIGQLLRSGCDKPEAEGMIRGVQSFMAAAGDTACYALCIVWIAEIENNRDIDPVRAMLDGIREGYIRFNWDDMSDGWNFYIDWPAQFLRMMTGKRWDIRHDAHDYRKRLGEHVVQRWERETTDRTFSHFRLPDWDPLINSQTVRYGRIVSTRVFSQ